MAYLSSEKNTIGSDDADRRYWAQEDVSHIILAKLYPSYGYDLAGNALVATTTGPNSSTVASSKYGTVQASDGRMYYYTNIKGSKPIKDPRIGAHYGVHRHPFRSMQKLDQETAYNSFPVNAIDGREWIRAHGFSWEVRNDAYGVNLANHDGAQPDVNDWIEITGYFTQMNWIGIILSNTADNVQIWVDGVNTSTTFELRSDTSGGMNTPLLDRFVDAGSVATVPTGTLSLGIHTVKIGMSTSYWYASGCELVVQDITSTATKSQIQIPSQNVVSYGKKFTVTSSAPHYNPFAENQAGSAVAIADTTSHGKVATGWSGTGSGYFDSTLDEATSLGLSAWEKGGDFWRPVNGGRVVKWVDSSGNIKTSVNMMPPAGRHISAGGNSGDPDGTSWTSAHYPSYMAGALDHSQAETAKSMYAFEFGNGSANHNSSYRDMSTLYDQSGSGVDVSFVMDDGLTAFSADDTVGLAHGYLPKYNGDASWTSFIGTGCSISNVDYGTGHQHICQNSSYGSHILKCSRGSGSAPTYSLDGADFGSVSNSTYGSYSEITFYQPKMPPIPEDAVILADYMLMADFVPTVSEDITTCSKGSRLQSLSRDVFIDRYTGSATITLAQHVNEGAVHGYDLHGDGVSVRLPMFATNYTQRGYQSDTRTDLYRDASTSLDSSATKSNGATYGSYAYLTSDLTIGLHNLGYRGASGANGNSHRLEIATPIHTSHHYQRFETPYAYELVGGDRNMEQTNLVVTPDGQTWDEVTRDTRYMGSIVFNAFTDTNLNGESQLTFDEFRGRMGSSNAGHNNFGNKDFAITQHNFICLRAGTYSVHAYTISSASGGPNSSIRVRVNHGDIAKGHQGAAGYSQSYVNIPAFLDRGDLLGLYGRWHGSTTPYSGFRIQRMPERKNKKYYTGTKSVTDTRDHKRRRTAVSIPNDYRRAG